jgi:hypothetical protein
MTAVAGAALAVSLFVPWFDGVSGWEHWAWADVVLAALAAGLVALAFLRPRAPLGAAVAVLCALGVAVVLGHGFEPDDARVIGSVEAGPYLALAALGLGAIGALAPSPRHGGAVLLVAAAVGVGGALLSGWGFDGEYVVPFDARNRLPATLRDTPTPNGFERWAVLDVALLVLAAGLLLAAAGRAPKLLRTALAVACLAATACVLIGARDQLWIDDGVAQGLAMGPLAALLSLAAALAGLWVTRRAPAARDG